uniref:Uncharacterized protein n=1 Tax=Lotus japonicus TaxID=34305 RepID=I3SD75_LOTJA|nr:unknown [Lotus japonicus]
MLNSEFPSKLTNPLQTITNPKATPIEKLPNLQPPNNSAKVLLNRYPSSENSQNPQKGTRESEKKRNFWYICAGKTRGSSERKIGIDLRSRE